MSHFHLADLKGIIRCQTAFFSDKTETTKYKKNIFQTLQARDEEHNDSLLMRLVIRRQIQNLTQCRNHLCIANSTGTRRVFLALPVMDRRSRSSGSEIRRARMVPKSRESESYFSMTPSSFFLSFPFISIHSKSLGESLDDSTNDSIPFASCFVV